MTPTAGRRFADILLSGAFAAALTAVPWIIMRQSPAAGAENESSSRAMILLSTLLPAGLFAAWASYELRRRRPHTWTMLSMVWVGMLGVMAYISSDLSRHALDGAGASTNGVLVITVPLAAVVAGCVLYVPFAVMLGRWK